MLNPGILEVYLQLISHCRKWSYQWCHSSMREIGSSLNFHALLLNMTLSGVGWQTVSQTFMHVAEHHAGLVTRVFIDVIKLIDGDTYLCTCETARKEALKNLSL